MSEGRTRIGGARPTGRAPLRVGRGARGAQAWVTGLAKTALEPLRRFVAGVRGVLEPGRAPTVRHGRLPLPTGAVGAITVLSANLWHDWPRHRRLGERLESLARLVEAEGVDVVLLQEVARIPSLRVDEWLAERLGMSAVYSRANGHERAIGFEEGLAVLSRYPLAAPRSRMLLPSPSRFVRRMALGVDVLSPYGSLTAYSVHLGMLPGVNADQLDHLRLWVSVGAAGRTAFIGGDFNVDEDAPQIARARRTWTDVFRHLHPHADGTTHVLRWPWGARLRRSRLDYLFLHPGNRIWRVLEARHVTAPGRPHSDHRAVLARLTPEP